MLRYNATILLLCLISGAMLAQQRVEQRLLGRKIEGLVKDPKALYFIVVGDWGRNGQGDQQAVADWMGTAASQVNAKFVISTGDNFYCCGVASVDDHQWISSYENVFRSHSLQIPWYAALGNHDYQGNIQAQIDYTKRSQRWKLPARYYTQVYGNFRFAFIDTSPFIKAYHQRSDHGDLIKQDTARQVTWIDSVLSVATEPWKIIVGHHPVYSLGDHGNEPDMQRLLEERMRKHHVQVYFAGHDHSLQSLASKGKTQRYIISGGGSESTPVEFNSAIALFAQGTTGFAVVAASERQMTIYFIDSKGKMIHTDSIEQ